jgi:hypothetical protein
MPDFAPQQGTLPVLQYCPPAQLEVDPAYQRSIENAGSRRLIGEIARGWDWRLYQPLVVSRRADGRLFVVDGQHRLRAAALRGDVYQLPCVIVAHDGEADEARAFVALNQQRKPLTPFALFMAAIAAGDEEAVTIDRLVRAAGLRLTGAAGLAARKPGWIDCTTAIQRVFRRHGERPVVRTLEQLGKVFGGEVLRSSSTFFTAIAALVATEGDKLETWLLTEVLRAATQDEWLADFAKRAGDRGIDRRTAAAETIADAYGEAITEAKAA